MGLCEFQEAICRDANCSFFLLQYLVLFQVTNTCHFEQNASKYFFFQGSLCVHFYGNKMKNAVFQAKILFFILKNTSFFHKTLASLHLALGTAVFII